MTARGISWSEYVYDPVKLKHQWTWHLTVRWRAIQCESKLCLFSGSLHIYIICQGNCCVYKHCKNTKVDLRVSCHNCIVCILCFCILCLLSLVFSVIYIAAMFIFSHKKDSAVCIFCIFFFNCVVYFLKFLLSLNCLLCIYVFKISILIHILWPQVFLVFCTSIFRFFGTSVFSIFICI